MRRYCPPRNVSPSTIVAHNQGRERFSLTRIPGMSAMGASTTSSAARRRAISSVRLLNRSTNVFTSRMATGRFVGTQLLTYSLRAGSQTAPALRTTYAVVNETKIMTTELRPKATSSR